MGVSSCPGHPKGAWGELCLRGAGVGSASLLSSKRSPCSACWENSIPAGVLSSPLLPVHTSVILERKHSVGLGMAS